MWSIDRIEEDIAILENISTGEKKEVSVTLLPDNIKEGSMISYNNETYVLEVTEEQKRRQEILEKFRRLRKN